jgi:DNA-binding protein H-NS
MFKRKVEVSAASAEQRFELMTYDELLSVKTRVDQEIMSRGPGELEALKDKLTLIANAQGLSLAELFGEKPKAERKERKKREVKIRYRNPDNPDQTWSGLGRPKKWLQEKLDAGANLEEFAVA